MKSAVHLVFLFIVCGSHSVLVSGSCKALNDSSNFTAFESLLLTDSNLVQLEDALFPTNSHSSVVVNVNYHFYELPLTNKPAELHPGVKQVSHAINDVTKPDPVTQEDFINKDQFVFHFKWLASPVNLFVRPDLLQRLSLMTYRVDNIAVDLHFEAPCYLEEFSTNSTCTHLPKLLSQLNNLTSNVSAMC